jgi:ubiquinone/menaquinone biosynthesis C-methylase UbiE
MLPRLQQNIKVYNKGIKHMNFWDFCAPMYDFFERRNGEAYRKMIRAVTKLTPEGATVFEAACGTAEIGIAVSKKAANVLCTDMSEKMLGVAAAKIKKRGIKNITLSERSIYETNEADGAFDVVIASQILHLLDDPAKAAAELRRISKASVIMPLALTKSLNNKGKFLLTLYRLVGFSPKREFTAPEYKKFILELGFEGAKFITIDGEFPMVVAVWEK